MSGRAEVFYEVLKTPEYEAWLAKQTEKTQIIIDARLQRIVSDNHFGTINTFDG